MENLEDLRNRDDGLKVIIVLEGLFKKYLWKDKVTKPDRPKCFKRECSYLVPLFLPHIELVTTGYAPTMLFTGREMKLSIGLMYGNSTETEKSELSLPEYVNDLKERLRKVHDNWYNMFCRKSPRNKSWQGQAFETQMGAVNSLPCSPTPCLKIRGMFEDGDRNTHLIREAVLSKCADQCRILHCAVDNNSNCVYLKCADPSDAAIAYRNLHGWWYSGHLVTVKYLRLERYIQRFPDSPTIGPPYLQAVSSKKL